jgi:hypothetical protein
MVFNTTFNNNSVISWQSVLLVEETRVSGENYRPYHITLYCRHSCDLMVVGLTTTCAISSYHHYSSEFEPRSWRGALNTTLCDKVGNFLRILWFPPPIKLTATNYDGPIKLLNCQIPTMFFYK